MLSYTLINSNCRLKLLFEGQEEREELSSDSTISSVEFGTICAQVYEIFFWQSVRDHLCPGFIDLLGFITICLLIIGTSCVRDYTFECWSIRMFCFKPFSFVIFIYYSILVVCAVRRVFFRFFPLLFVSFVFLQMCSSLKCGQNFSPQYQRIFSPRRFWWKALFLLPKRMALFVPTLEVLRDRNVGLPPITSTVFHLIRSRSQSSCSVCLMKRILLLRFLTRSTALTGRYSWLAYQKSPVIPWLLQRPAPLKGFWAGLRSKKTL